MYDNRWDNRSYWPQNNNRLVLCRVYKLGITVECLAYAASHDITALFGTFSSAGPATFHTFHLLTFFAQRANAPSSLSPVHLGEIAHRTMQWLLECHYISRTKPCIPPGYALRCFFCTHRRMLNHSFASAHCFFSDSFIAEPELFTPS